MNERAKKILFASAVAAGAVVVFSALDIFTGIPFAGYSKLMDGLFIVSGLIVLFMAYDNFKDLR